MGYATINVNIRGTGCSGGAFDYFETLQNLDGYDVIEVAAAQDWVLHNQVGMVGLSYPGITQLFVAAERPPGLSAITPLSVIGNSATTMLPGGILNDGFALIDHHLHPSTLSYPSDDKAFRTSQSSYLCHLKSPVAVNIDAKICKTLGIRVEYSEGIQAQRYDVGQQFKPHWDYFEPGTKEYLRFAGTRGNRTWTFMVYLNEGMEGGGTRFTKIDHTFAPKTGTALLWNNLNADATPNEFTMHSGEPVIAGHKVIITKWFRAIGDGPVYYG
jgi:hypothetical protein